MLPTGRKRKKILTQTKQELDLAIRKVEVADNTKSRFLTNISQEIRTPLSSIIGFSQIIIRDMAAWNNG